MQLGLQQVPRVYIITVDVLHYICAAKTENN